MNSLPGTPARRHGLDGVEREVEEDLQELLGVGAHGRHPIGEGGDDLDGALLRRLLVLGEQREGLPEHVGDLQRPLLAAVGARVVEELRDDLVEAVHLLDDDVEELPGPLARPLRLAVAVFSTVVGGLQELRGPLDRPERIPDLVRQTGRHLPQRRQTVALLHPLVDLRVLQRDADGGGDAAEDLDLVGGVGLAQPVVADDQRAEQLIFAREPQGHRAVHLLQRAQHELQALLLLGRDRTPRRHLALDPLQRDDARAAQPLEEGAVGDGVEAPLRLRPDVTAELVAGAVGIGQVDRGVGDPARVLERPQDARHQHPHVDDVGQLAPQRLDPPRQLELLLEHPAADPPLDPGAQRLDQDDDRRRRQQRVEEEEPGLVGADPANHHPVDEGEDEDQRPQHHHAPEQLVQIEQPVADEVLRQEVEVDDDEDVAEARPVRERLGDRGGDGGEAADQQVEEPLLLDPRRRRPVAAVEIEDRQVEAGEHVGHERDVERQRPVHRLDEARKQQDAVEDRRAEHRRPAERRRPRLVAEKGLKEPLRRGRQRDGRQQRRPVPQRRLEPLGDERQRAVDRDVEGERGEEHVRAAARLPQKDRAPEREGDDGRDQRGDRLNAQSVRILAQIQAGTQVGDAPAFCRDRTRPAMFRG